MSSLSFKDLHFPYPGSRLFRHPPVRVFAGFSWDVPAGATVLLGPNGAGKTTLLAIAATALRPTDGSVRFNDVEAGTARGRRAMRREIGWMPQHVRAIPGLTAREQVAYAGWLKGMARGMAWSASATALERVGLSDVADRLTGELSGGQQRRVALAQLLVHDAQMLLLDEPTAGLDPGQRARLRHSLREMAVQAPLVVSTHQVDDLTDLFDTVVVIAHGTILFTGSPAEFVALARALSH